MSSKKIKNLINEELRKLLKEYFANKEEFKFFEDLANRQHQIYPDAADAGITPEDKDFDNIKPNLKKLVETYGSKNKKYSYGSGTSGGEVKLFIPIEMSDRPGKISGYVLEVSFFKDPKLKKLYRKEYDGFFSIDVYHTEITKQEAIQNYNSK